MSINALVVASEAARRCGDPNFTRIKREDWLDFLNAVSRDIATRIPCVEWEATAATVANEERMEYPSDMVQIRFVRYSEEPGTIDYYDLKEKPFDQWREDTSRSYPLDNISEYCPRQSHLCLVGRPTTAISAAVLLCYFGLPEDLTDLTTQNIGLPDMLRTYLVEGMVIQGKRKDKEFDEAAQLEAVWLARESEWRDRVSDRARDRRASFRTEDTRRRYSRLA